MSYPTQALIMVMTYKLSTDKTKQDSWPTMQNTALCPKKCFKDNIFKLYLKKTLWPLFMDGVQQPQG